MDPPTLTTEQTYNKILVEEGLTPEVEKIDGFSLCWIGSKTAKSIIIHVCGGGLVWNPYEPHIKIPVEGYKVMQANHQDASIVIVAHTLCPTSPYPTQIRQMVLAIQHLLKTRDASSIHLSGDSAGGTLHLALLLHITHPHPSVSSLTLPSASKFASAFLVSPASPYPSGTKSMLREPVKDILNPTVLKETWDLIVSTKEEGIDLPNPWIVPSLADEVWWKHLPIGEVVVLVGDEEILRDDILKTAEGIKKYHDSEVKIYKCAGEVHCQPLVDLAMGVTEDKESTRVWKKWFQDFKS